MPPSKATSPAAAAKKKRVRNWKSGSVYQRTSDGLWIGSIEAGLNAAGNRRRIKLSGKTKAEVTAKLKAKQRQIIDGGIPTEGVSAKTTVRQWADVWLKRTERTLKPTTWRNNRTTITKWAIPTIGNVRLDALSPLHLAAVADAQRDAGLKPSSILRAHAVLAKMLKSALVDGSHTISARVLAMDRPESNEADRGEIPIEDALALLEQAGSQPDGSRWLISFIEGVRQSEVLGLTWDAIDLDAPIPNADISWQLQALPYKHGCAEPCGKRPQSCPDRAWRIPDGYEKRQVHLATHLVRPKTAKGKRIIPLLPGIVAALAEWRKACPESPRRLVWPRADGTPRSVANDIAAWHALQDAAQVACWDGDLGRRYGTHEMRHTAATMLMRLGIDPETIKAILGHSSMLSQVAYKHADLTMKRDALMKVSERLQLG